MASARRKTCLRISASHSQIATGRESMNTTPESSTSASMTHAIPPGRHLLIDFWGGKYIQDEAAIEDAMRDAARACEATVLEVRLHSFGAGGADATGITGVAILAESHISIHTWPELDYIALDIFVCGERDPRKALNLLRSVFQPTRERIIECHRGSEEPVVKEGERQV